MACDDGQKKWAVLSVVVVVLVLVISLVATSLKKLDTDEGWCKIDRNERTNLQCLHSSNVVYKELGVRCRSRCRLKPCHSEMCSL